MPRQRPGRAGPPQGDDPRRRGPGRGDRSPAHPRHARRPRQTEGRTPMTGWDWAFWSAGGTIALTGLLLCAWALFRDRPRGRRRCPQCWDDLGAVPGLTCPECGREARTETRLFRTRRRWRWAIVGASFMVLGLAGAGTPIVASGNWVGYTPIPLLNFVLSFWP